MLAICVLFALPAVAAHAQSPAPAAETTDDDGGRPWGRLAIFIPLSVAIGAGAIYARRAARDRGWLSS